MMKENRLLQGRITKALSGFYYVTTQDGQTYQTRARGVFRNKNITPLVGDYVEFTTQEGQDGTVNKILERKNELTRPPVSNIDTGFVITSVVYPNLSTQLLDRMLVLLESHHINPIIYVTKMDLVDDETKNIIDEFRQYYQSIGYSFEYSHDEEIDREMFKELIGTDVVVFMGQSGVGKSTLLNKLDASLNLKTAETSIALGRGKHTTRHVELLPIFEGYIADTPGFSSLELSQIEKEELTQYFPEFWSRRAECKFKGCIHNKEPKCAVKTAVSNGDIAEHRYQNYLTFLEEIENRKPKY